MGLMLRLLQNYKLAQIVFISNHLNYTLSNHGIGNFNKTTDVSAINVVDKSILFGSVFTACFMDVYHDLVQALINLLAVHDKRSEFCDISSPEVATPPALAALPGP